MVMLLFLRVMHGSLFGIVGNAILHPWGESKKALASLGLVGEVEGTRLTIGRSRNVVARPIGKGRKVRRKIIYTIYPQACYGTTPSAPGMNHREIKITL